VPADWLLTKGNMVVLLEEIGGNPFNVTLVQVGL
jgi:hypothetical protein